MGFMSKESLEKTVNISALIKCIIAVIAVGGKIYYDVYTSKEKIELLKVSHETQKASVEEQKTAIIEMDKVQAVMKEKVEAVGRQNTAIIIKIDEVYKLLLEEKRNK